MTNFKDMDNLEGIFAHVRANIYGTGPWVMAFNENEAGGYYGGSFKPWEYMHEIAVYPSGSELIGRAIITDETRVKH